MQRSGGVFSLELLEERPGFVQIAVTGQGARETFKNEGGGHRYQRTPPTEKRGRVHTSTVTVAVMDPDKPVGKALNLSDVEITTTRDSGPGGQNRNKVESCVVAVHRPTGIRVKIAAKSQHRNRALALQVLAGRLYELEREKQHSSRAADRKEQVGSGMRGDKVRTYRTQDDQVVDHRTGQRWRLSNWLRGIW